MASNNSEPVRPERMKQTDCRYEPNYPDHETVVFAMSAPDMTAHGVTKRCSTEEPHLIADCGEFNGGIANDN